VEDGIKEDHFLLNKKRITDNIDGSSTKKKIDNRIRVAEITLNESELEVLSGENLEKAENKAALLYAEYRCLDYGYLTKSLEDSKILKKDRELIFPIAPNIHQERINRHKQAYGLALAEENQDFNNLEGVEMNNNTGKKELDHFWDIIQNAIIKAANQTLPKKKILNTGCSRKRSKVKTELEKSILVLGKIIRDIHNGKKKILEKKYLTENTISKNKEIQKKVKKHCEMIVNNQGQMLVSLLNKPYNKIIINKLVLEKQDHSRELITKPEEVMSITEKHFQNQYQKRNTRPNLLTQKWAEIYKPTSYVQESLYENLLVEISEEE
ncbi:35715_t:CDS:2, partial [Gigaspora margarita]